MTVYTPAFETQRDDMAPTPWTNCNPASVAMLMDWYTYGAINVSDVDLRRASPVPLNVGMNFAQVSEAVKAVAPALGGLLYSEVDGSGNANITWDQLRNHLIGGGGAVVCGNYGDVGFRNSKGWGVHVNDKGQRIDRWQPDGTFGHAVYVGQGDANTVLLMDPLGHGDYRGDRIGWGALWDFIWKSGWADQHVRIVAAHWFTGDRPAAPAATPAPPSLADRLATKDAFCDAAGLRLRQLERELAADASAVESAIADLRASHALRLEAARKELRALRGS